MKEKISAILDDYIIKIAFLGGNESMVAEKTNARIRLIDELEKLYQQEYLNSCIEKATPALSKIKDVDKELSEIRGENNCNNCAFGICLTKDWPCADCNGSNNWEPIK